MEDLTKEAIQKAIQKIEENPELRKGRESYIYDLEYNGKIYPPILVISEANKFLGESEVTIRDFNNSTKKAFKLLTEHGFIVSPKSSNIPNVWFVYQGSTFTENRGKKFLWAPEKNKAGHSQFYWENMQKVKKGDIIFNYVKGIKAVSIAKGECYMAPNPDENSQWQKNGYKVDINCHELNQVIPIGELVKRKVEIDFALKEISRKPFNNKGGPNQGYFYEFTKEAGKILRDIYGEPFGIEPIDEFFGEQDAQSSINAKSLEFRTDSFIIEIEESKLFFSRKLLIRYISALITKPFVILTGLTGSGKTKLAQAFAQWICQDDSQYCIVPVGADWTNREPLLGYPNALKPDEYIKPDNGALDVIIQAIKHPELPFFLILDEMNLSHVERYFADFLSVMESKGEISLFAEGTVNNGVPSKLALPSNLFIIGTVNIDETTYMFSPKVLDRANAIEFRVTKDEIKNFFASQKEVDMNKLKTQGASMAQSFLKMAEKIEFEEQDLSDTHKTLVNFFEQLKKTGAEFGYRSASEIIRLINQLAIVDAGLDANEKLDIAIMQKLLPKLHGSRRKLCPVLLTLGGFCVDKAKIENIEKDIFAKEDFDFETDGVIYPISLEKITRMYKGAIENGFASYAEA